MSTLDEKIRVGADQLKLTLSQGQISQLVRYAALIQKWNRATRLVGDEGDDALALQILDSLAILRLSLPEAACLDIGSGAGLPGIPLAIVRADIPIELLEPRERRASFLSEAKRLLNLANVTIVCDRLEKRSYSTDTLAMAKAVAPPPRLLQMADQAGLKQVVVMANQKTEASAAGNGWTALERDIVPLRFKPEHVNILLRKDEPT